MIKIGRALGMDVYADTDDPKKANQLGMMINRALRHDGKWDWDNDKQQFVERETTQ
jgi:hypothetical protein